MEKQLRGRPAKYVDGIRALKKGQEHWFLGASMASIKAIASRVAAAEGRVFKNRSEDGGVWVWRLK